MKTVKGKLLGVCLSILLVPILVLGSVSYFSAKNSLTENGQVMIENSVHLALQMIETVNQQVEAGELSLEEAQEAVKAQLIGELQPDGTRPIETPVDLGDNGYFAVYDESGTLIAHPVIEGQNLMDIEDVNGFSFVKDVFEKAYNGGGFTEYAWALPNDPEKIEDKIMYSAYDPNWGWIISTGSYYSDFNEGANDILTLIAITAAIALTIGSVLVILFSRSLSKPIIKVRNHLNEMSQNNLALADIKVKNKDEIGQLADSLNQMKNNLSGMVGRIYNVSHTLAASSEELTASAEETNRATEQIAGSIQLISENANDQSSKAMTSKQTVQGISGRISDIRQYLISVNDATNDSSIRVQEGKKSIQDTSDKMSTIQEKTREAAKAVHELGSQSQQIGQIVGLITEVAEQTNLLALNAAIEAARAGEHGKGFAVVADEIRKLAEQSSRSASQIQDLITHIRKGIDQSVSFMSEGEHSVSEGMEAMHQTGQEFTEIEASTSSIVSAAQKVLDAVSDLDFSASQMVNSVQSTAEMIEHSSAESQSIAAASEEQSASMEQVAASSHALAKMAEELSEVVGEFKV
ncbi:methyl-accepting chemotaxis protein [Jeotgalibacillus aurantiacus]|uniref:methyl-accepting chemotaxis protein n=1 Tax=Jeotgalibacillus aurantiacus TaxID=2763266 RepID=UPI001D0B8CD3|nr:methyl-accepting chemotaxis protein [Jeotgalibacillus aurantiacus]